MEQINAIGRRKAAVARVYVKEGSGVITINKRPLEVYFPSSILQFIVKQPLNVLQAAEKYDIKVTLGGGGYKGQAEALRLAIARALIFQTPLLFRIFCPGSEPGLQAPPSPMSLVSKSARWTRSLLVESASRKRADS